MFGTLMFFNVLLNESLIFSHFFESFIRNMALYVVRAVNRIKNMNDVSVTCRWLVLLNCLFIFSVVQAEVIDIKYTSKTQILNVEQCFEQAPQYVKVGANLALKTTQSLTWQNQPVNYSSGYAYLPQDSQGCLLYSIKPTIDSNNRRSSRFQSQHKGSLLISIDDWMWQAKDYKERALPEVRIHHEKHIQVSAPWHLINRSITQTTYQIKPTPKYSDGFLAIGPMNIRDVYLGDSRLRLAIMSGNSEHNPEMLQQWVTQMADSVAQVGISFPVKDIQVLLILMSGSGGPVPWGQVNRAGGQGVLLVVNPTISKKRLFSDWTAAHEFSHLLMPYTPNDRWLSEGFASYHQNISRMRVGMLDEATAWSKLVAGFERGKKSAAKSFAPKLNQAGRKNNMQMYWGGAVIALKADVALQQQSKGKMNLSKALNGLQNCCLDTGRAWSAKKLFQELDRITESQVFSQLYEGVVRQQPYPDYQLLLEELGVKKKYNGQIEFDNLAPKAHIRKKISNG